MKRFVLSLVTALSLMGAAQSFALPVPVTENVSFRRARAAFSGNGGVRDSASIATFNAAQKLDTTAAFSTAKFYNPMIYTSTASVIPDTVVFATFRFHKKPGSSANFSGTDSAYFAFEVSADGTNWVLWSPGATHVGRVASMLGSNKAIAAVAVVPADSSRAFTFQLRQIPTSQNTDGGGAMPNVLASVVTEIAGWNQYPLMRLIVQGDWVGEYVMSVRYWDEQNKIVRRDVADVRFRTTGSAYPGGFIDSTTARTLGSGATTAVDTTVAVSMDNWLPADLRPTYNATTGADSTTVARLVIFNDAGVYPSPTSMDSVYVTPEISFDGSNWLDIGTISPPEITAADSWVIPIKISATGHNHSGWLSSDRSGSTRTLGNVYNCAPLIRFLIRRDGTALCALRAQIHFRKAVKG